MSGFFKYIKKSETDEKRKRETDREKDSTGFRSVYFNGKIHHVVVSCHHCLFMWQMQREKVIITSTGKRQERLIKIKMEWALWQLEKCRDINGRWLQHWWIQCLFSTTVHVYLSPEMMHWYHEAVTYLSLSGHISSSPITVQTGWLANEKDHLLFYQMKSIIPNLCTRFSWGQEYTALLFNMENVRLVPYSQFMVINL